jgi:peptidylprolyl isomerase
VPPAKLVTTDLTVGDGAEAKAGDRVTVQYVGVSCSTGKQFDASWDSGRPATFSLDEVIAGWTEGIPGMKVGGRRLLMIPPALGYGSRPPSGSGIAPGETLIFVVDLVALS